MNRIRIPWALALTVLAALALVAFTVNAGLAPDSLFIAAGALPLAIGNAESIEAALAEIKSKVDGRLEAVETRSKKVDADLTTLAKQFADSAIGANRPNGRSDGDENSVTAETKAFLQFCRSGRVAPEMKSSLWNDGLSTDDDPRGGYMIAPQLEKSITSYLRSASAMRQLARVVKVSGGEYQQVHASVSASYAWVGERDDRSEQPGPEFSLLSIPTREIYTNIGITQTLLDDNGFDLENWLVDEISKAFGDGESAAFCVGAGATQPRGLFTHEVVSTSDATRPLSKFQYVPSGASGALAGSAPSDAFITLLHAVKPQYRRNASWLVSPDVLEAIRKLKDGTGAFYLWQQSTQAGQPDLFMGYPIFEDESVPTMAANSLSVAFGDFQRAYTITDRSTMLLRDPYSEKPYVMFYAAKRVGGGGGRDTRAVKFMKMSAS